MAAQSRNSSSAPPRRASSCRRGCPERRGCSTRHLDAPSRIHWKRRWSRRGFCQRGLPTAPVAREGRCRRVAGRPRRVWAKPAARGSSTQTAATRSRRSSRSSLRPPRQCHQVPAAPLGAPGTGRVPARAAPEAGLTKSAGQSRCREWPMPREYLGGGLWRDLKEGARHPPLRCRDKARRQQQLLLRSRLPKLARRAGSFWVKPSEALPGVPFGGLRGGPR